MVATGNDFVLFDCMKWKPEKPNSLARQILNRRYGIGGDQMLLVMASRKADFKMQAFNPDGSEAEMCGNGIRCVGRYVATSGLTRKKEFTIETLAGIKTLKGTSKTFTVDMGEPKMKGKEIPVNLSGRIINRPLKMESKEFRITCLSMGNPHAVIFMEDLANFQVSKFGPMIETFHIFPRKTNVEFANAISDKEIQMRVWERGTGETDGCGTGACAVALAGVLNGHTGRHVTISQPGGKVEVHWDKDNNHVYMSGPAETLYTGTFDI
jgi:diaminopimelate epimerase